VILAMQPFAHFSLGKAGTPSVRPLFGAFLTFLLCGCANVEYTAYSGNNKTGPSHKVHLFNENSDCRSDLTELRGAVSSRPLPYAGRVATLQLENPGQEVNQCQISFLTHSGYLKSSQTR
jgi:hypothetical protein